MIAALAGSPQSIGTSATRQAFAGLPREPEPFMLIGTVKKLGNLYKGRISQNKQKAMKKNRHHPTVYKLNFYPKWQTYIDTDFRDVFFWIEGYSIYQRYKNKSRFKHYRIRYRRYPIKLIKNYKTYPAH